MLAHMKKPPIKSKHMIAKKISMMNFYVSCPSSNADNIKKYLEKQGCTFLDDEHEFLNAKELFTDRTPSNMLIGARGKENITQNKLSELTGIPRRHISDMENGRRPIGKQNAIKLGKALNINYQLFL